MRLVTSYGLCDHQPTAAISWEVGATHRVPYHPINSMLAVLYSQVQQFGGNPPYLYRIANDNEQVGLFVADIRRVGNDGETIAVDVEGAPGLAIFQSILAEERINPQPTPWQAFGPDLPSAWRSDMSLAVLGWKLPKGEIFPVDCLNAVLHGMYQQEAWPFLYPVFNAGDDSGATPQIGVLISGRRSESGTSAQLAARVVDDYDALMRQPPGAKQLPWKQEVFNVA